MRQISRKYDRASVNPGVGIGVPLGKADIPPKRGFCVRSMATSLYGRAVRGCLRARRTLSPVRQPARPCPPKLAFGWREKTAGKDPTMIKRRILTLNPSKARAAYHRACALASLHSSSSLSVRLARYNHHMQAARVFTQQGGCDAVAVGGDV